MNLYKHIWVHSLCMNDISVWLHVECRWMFVSVKYIYIYTVKWYRCIYIWWCLIIIQCFVTWWLVMTQNTWWQLRVDGKVIDLTVGVDGDTVNIDDGGGSGLLLGVGNRVDENSVIRGVLSLSSGSIRMTDF